MSEDDLYYQDNEGRFPLSIGDKPKIERVIKLVRDQLSRMNPSDLRAAASVLLALERLPAATPGVSVTIGFSQPNNDGNYGWADIKISEEEFRLSEGEHFYDPSVGGDTETRSIFETEVGGNGCRGEELPRIIAEDSNDLTPTMRRLLQELFDDPKTLESRIAVITREIESLAARDEKARRLMTMPEIGPLRRFLRLPAMGSNLRRRVTWRLGLALSLSNIPRAAAIIDRDHLLIRSRPLPRRTEFSEATAGAADRRGAISRPSRRDIHEMRREDNQ